MKGKVLKTKDVLPLGWKVSFDLNPYAVVGGFSSILHGTINTDNRNYGDRTPAIWFLSGTTRMHMCSAINGNRNYCFNTPTGLNLHETSNIVVQQILDPKDGKYHYKIFINGKQVFSVINTRPQVFKNVKYYSGDPWYGPAKAKLTNFKLTTY